MKTYKQKPSVIIWNGENWMKFSVAMNDYQYGKGSLRNQITQGKIRTIDYLRIQYLSVTDLKNEEFKKINF